MPVLARVPDSQSNCDVLSRLMREAMQQFEGLFWNTAVKPSEEMLNRPQHIVRTLHRADRALDACQLSYVKLLWADFRLASAVSHLRCLPLVFASFSVLGVASKSGKHGAPEAVVFVASIEMGCQRAPGGGRRGI